MRHAVARFERVNGPLPFRDIADEHARRFKDDLLGDGAVKAATKAKLWSLVGTLMRVARHDNLVAAHPFERVRLGRLKDDAARREDFARDELATMFRTLDGEEWWMARLGLYTGARLGELCQLTKPDLAERDGVAYLRIRADAAKGQRVKNRNSVRDVPLHRQLLADGFVAWARSRPGERLFSYPSAVASKRLLRRFEAMGLGEGKVVHSLRHSFKTAARGVMGQEWHDALTGHAGASVSNGYGRFPVPDLRAKIDFIAFGIETA
jgi:integrase